MVGVTTSKKQQMILIGQKQTGPHHQLTLDQTEIIQLEQVAIFGYLLQLQITVSIKIILGN